MENTMRVWVYQVAMRQPNIQVIGIPEGKERECGRSNTWGDNDWKFIIFLRAINLQDPSMIKPHPHISRKNI